MDDPFLFKTICVGGPLDGESVIEASGKLRFTCQRQLSGCEVLPGDDILSGLEPETTNDDYILVVFSFPWPSGVHWLYSFWLHESLTGENLKTFLSSPTWHFSDCYVVRMRAELLHEPSRLFRDGQFTMSRN